MSDTVFVQHFRITLIVVLPYRTNGMEFGIKIILYLPMV